VTVAPEREPRHGHEVDARVERLHDFPERQLALTETDRVGDAFLEVQLGRDAREPAAPDHRERGELRAHRLRDVRAVRDLIAEDATAREEQRAIARLEHLRHVVGLDHGVDEHALVPVLIGESGDLQELERRQVRAHAHALIRVRAMRQEQDDAFLALDHQGAELVASERCSRVGPASGCAGFDLTLT
jgi:hypothetical protein